MADSGSFSMQVDGIDRLEEALVEAPQITEKVLRGAMTEAVIVTQREVVDRTPVAWGNLHGSIAHQVQVAGGVVEGIVGTNATYALWVEDDTKPHWPPLEPLIAWVRKKGLSGVYSLKTKRRLGNKDVQAEQDRGIAWGIALKIHAQGTKGVHMFRDGLEAAKPAIQRIFNEAIDDILWLISRQ